MREYDPDAYEDLRFAAQGINPPGAASDPTRDPATGLLVFSGTQDKVIAGVAQLPHKWVYGSPVYPHVHLRFTTSAAANTRWAFSYDIGSLNNDFTNASGTYTLLSTTTIPNPQNVNQHVYYNLGTLPMVGHGKSAMVLWQVARLAASDGLDTDTNACLLMEFDLHYQLGSL